MIPESNHKVLVDTPYGRGVLLRTRQTLHGIAMKEIELTGWTEGKDSRIQRRHNMLFSPSNFPRAKPEMGDEVITLFGRGKVTGMKSHQIVVVRISSWRLARRAVVTCFLSIDAVCVVLPHDVHEMTVHEKIEYAQDLKTEASSKFGLSNYNEALKLYAKAVDAVRNVQHTSGSSNEMRADLLVVMITCCNNAGTCSLLLQQWDETYKFGKNALVLLDALYERRRKSKILELLYKEGLNESKLFGTWRVKSLLLASSALAERHDTGEALTKLKQALSAIAEYKEESNPMFRQLLAQEKEARKLLFECKRRIKAEKKREKERAVAMFGGSEFAEQQHEVLRPIETNARPYENESIIRKAISAEEVKTVEEDSIAKLVQTSPRKKKVSFDDGTVPGYLDEEDEDEVSFLQKHKEALLLLVMSGLGSVVARHFMKRRS